VILRLDNPHSYSGFSLSYIVVSRALIGMAKMAVCSSARIRKTLVLNLFPGYMGRYLAQLESVRRTVRTFESSIILGIFKL